MKTGRYAISEWRRPLSSLGMAKFGYGEGAHNRNHGGCYFSGFLEVVVADSKGIIIFFTVATPLVAVRSGVVSSVGRMWCAGLWCRFFSRRF